MQCLKVDNAIYIYISIYFFFYSESNYKQLYVLYYFILT